MATDPVTPLLLEAIVKRLAVVVVYNRTEATIAPHVLYTRHGDLHLDAITLEREGRTPREEKLGTFKLTGLSNVRLTTRPFRPSALFDPAADRYRDETVMAVDRAD